MDCSTPGLPVHHPLMALAQIHVRFWWCHPTISSSVVPFPSCLQSLPASGYFQMSQLFASGGQNIGVSASTSVLPMNTQDWSPLGWTGWISLQSKGLLRVFSNTTVQKHHFFGAQLSLESNSHIHMTTGKSIALSRRTFVGNVMSLLLTVCNSRVPLGYIVAILKSLPDPKLYPPKWVIMPTRLTMLWGRKPCVFFFPIWPSLTWKPIVHNVQLKCVCSSWMEGWADGMVRVVRWLWQGHRFPEMDPSS